MDVRALKAYCARLPGAMSRALGPPHNILLHEVGGKQFAYFKLSEPEKWRFSFRTTPERFLELTGIPGIKPARYMARFHWVTVVDVRSVPGAYLRELAEWSYRRAFASLPRTKQAALAVPAAPRQPVARQRRATGVT
ncbi:MAG: MmcQ/YjbR family DNA-binding protein [Dokdonella sp.]|uniref:MmcQ/YjbR family DNA-binding protein n=1 Tax=Dokdonella sp. TaxID=2291710 RepID=UPI003F7F82EE